MQQENTKTIEKQSASTTNHQQQHTQTTKDQLTKPYKKEKLQGTTQQDK